MLKRFRQYLTPVVATVALALLGATAVAVTPEIMDRVSDNSLDQAADTQEPTDTTDTTDVIDELKAEDLETDPLDEDGDAGDVPAPTVTPTLTGSEKPNHGRFVSCVAHMAKEDSTLEGRQKGAVVSYAAKQDIVLPKGNEAACAAAAVDADETREDVANSSTETEKQESDAVSGVAQETHKPAGQGRGPKAAGHKGGHAAK